MLEYLQYYLNKFYMFSLFLLCLLMHNMMKQSPSGKKQYIF